MLFDRRSVLTGTCALIATRITCRAAGAQDRAVFWRVTPPGAAPSILFGYDVVAAAAAPNLLATGERLAAPTRHLIIDMPSARFFSRRVKLDTIPTLAERYGPATTQRLLAALRAAAPQWPKPDILPGKMIALVLFGEGRTPNGTGDTLPATLFAQMFQTGEATSYLVPLAEVVRRNLIPDSPGEIGEGPIAYLLDLRDKLGPLGKYAETLYLQERLADIRRFHFDLLQHGFSLVPNALAWMDVLAERAIGAIRSARKPTFLMMPSDNFVGDDGILARLERAGVPVEAAG